MRRLLLAVSTLIVCSSTLHAQQQVAPEVKPIARAQRPLLAVRNLTFAAQLAPDELHELNGWQGLSVLLGRDGNGGQRVDAHTNMDLLASQLTNMLMEALISSGNFRILEREKLGAVLDEQDLGTSGRAAHGQQNADTAKLLTAKYIITGAITKFGKSTKKRGGFGGMVGGAIRGTIGVGVESSSTEYEIGIVLRIIDASTGEGITSVKTEAAAKGNVSRRIGGFGIVGGALGGAFSSSTTGEREKRVAEAMQSTVEVATLKLVELRERGEFQPNN